MIELDIKYSYEPEFFSRLVAQQTQFDTNPTFTYDFLSQAQ